MPNETLDNTIVKQGEIALFAYRENDPTDLPAFQGLAVVDSLTQPSGDLTPIRLPDPTQPNNFITVGLVRSAPDLGEIGMLERIRNNKISLSEKMNQELCPFGIILKIDNCSRKDVLSSWQSIWLVRGVQSTEYDGGTLMQFEENEPLEATNTSNHLGFRRLFPIRLTEEASSTVLAEVLDAIYADTLSCGSCTPYSSGCNVKFAITKSNPSSVGLSGPIVFTKDDVSWNTDDINSLAGANGTSLVAIGQYLVVTQSTSSQRHHYALKSAVLNTPNAYNWTAVSTGYSASGGPTCSCAGDANRFFAGGLGGYAYGSDDITSSVTQIQSADVVTQNFNAIAYNQGNLLIVGSSNTITLSTNALDALSNITFTALTGPSAQAGVHATACWIRTANYFEVGYANGKFYYTNDGGTTWTQRLLPNQSNLTYINDVSYSPDFPQVGAMAVGTTTLGYILRTFDGGRTWYNSAPAISQLGTAPQKYNAVALCGVNAIFTGGLKSGSTDGVLAEAT